MGWTKNIWFGQALEDVTGPYKKEKRRIQEKQTYKPP
jgi:hypothetical protein